LSITESAAREPYDAPGDAWGDGPAPYEPGEAPRGPGDRTPPQDMAAEQSVLGSMLISKDAIADVTETIRGVDFYRPAHETIHDAIIDLFGRGEPVDMVTVAAELQRRGELQRIGGAPYLHTLAANVPIAANAGFYAEIVREKAILRRLVDAGTKIVQIGYAGEGQVDDIVDRAQAEVYQITDRRTAEDYAPLSEIMTGVLDEIEAIGNREAGLYGVPTGFADLDELTNGLHTGQMVIVAARPAMGKALALDTPLPTPTGWTTMGAIKVGEELYDAQGRPTRVVAATEVMHDRPCYEVEFSDGSRIVADAQHQWLTDTRASRRSHQAVRDGRNRTGTQRTPPGVRTTREIAATLRTATAERRLNHSVALAAPLQLPEAALPLPPYVLGAWLGDGCTDGAVFTTADAEMVVLLEAEGLSVTPSSTPMRYSLQLAQEPVAARACVVCGTSFVPGTSQVKTCGRSCGGRAKGTPAMPAPTCPDCGRPSSGLRRCQACRNEHGTVRGLLRSAGVLGDKHIPAAYLRASEAQRRALLAGLVDTDGTVTAGGCVQFTTTSERLQRDVYELVVSLGYRCGVSRRAVRGRTTTSSTAYTLTFSSDE
jgi:replicative DNA helicase